MNPFQALQSLVGHILQPQQAHTQPAPVQNNSPAVTASPAQQFGHNLPFGNPSQPIVNGHQFNYATPDINVGPKAPYPNILRNMHFGNDPAVNFGRSGADPNVKISPNAYLNPYHALPGNAYKPVDAPTMQNYTSQIRYSASPQFVDPQPPTMRSV